MEWFGLSRFSQDEGSWEYVRSVLVPLKIREQAERVARYQKRFPHESLRRILLAA
jgi:hypothetical protein